MKKLLIFASTLFIFSTGTMSDTVEEVYTCGDDVGIKTRANGWIVARQADIGIDRLNRIFSIALTLLSTQKPTGFYDAGAPITWCGIADIKPITALAIRAE